jgi:hypothetical protein
MKQSELTLLMNNESGHIADWFIIFSTSLAGVVAP